VVLIYSLLAGEGMARRVKSPGGGSNSPLPLAGEGARRAGEGALAVRQQAACQQVRCYLLAKTADVPSAHPLPPLRGTLSRKRARG
jgi:hypothetical protein